MGTTHTGGKGSMIRLEGPKNDVVEGSGLWMAAFVETIEGWKATDSDAADQVHGGLRHYHSAGRLAERWSVPYSGMRRSGLQGTPSKE